MDQNFKCRSCGVVFTDDDSHEVKCPSCNSDNIDIFKGNKGPQKTVLFALIGFVVAIGIGIGIKFLIAGDKKNYNSMDDEYVPAEETVISSNFSEETPTYVDPEPIKELQLEFNNDLTPDNKTKTYSFSYTCKNLPENAQVEYKLYDFGTGDLVKTSPDGKFTGVPPSSAEDGSYRVEIEAKVGNQTVTASHIVTGCVKFPEKTLEKLTVAQVQALVNQMISSNRSAILSNNPQISPNVVLKFVDLRSDDVAPTSISKLLSQVTLGLWSGMTVVSVGYDESTSRVNVITIRPIYAD